MRKDNFILVIDQQSLIGNDYFKSDGSSKICYGRLGIMLSKNIPLNKYFSFISEFKFGPDELWGLLDYEKVGLIKNNSIIIPIEKYIMINLDTKFNHPEKINDMFLATKEQREFFNNKIVLKEDCEYIY